MRTSAPVEYRHFREALTSQLDQQVLRRYRHLGGLRDSRGSLIPSARFNATGPEIAVSSLAGMGSPEQFVTKSGQELEGRL